MACDPFWNKTVLACHFDGSNGSTTFIDEKGHTLTVNGTAQISTSQSKFGGASGSFPGSANRATVPDGPEFYLGKRDFTAEAWIYPTMLDANLRAVISQANNIADNSNRQFSLQMSSSTLVWYWTTNGVSDQMQSFSCTITVNAWSHVAIVRKGDILYGFLNGTLLAAVGHTPTYFDSTASVCIGTFGKYSEDGYPYLSFNGYIDDLRLTLAARYTKSFSVDTSAFVTNQCTAQGNVKDSSGANAKRLVRIMDRKSAALIGSGMSDPTSGNYSIPVETLDEYFMVFHDVTSDDFYWDEVTLACHFDGTNGSTTFTDEKGHTLTVNGNAQISTAQSKFGGASGYFDGAGDYLSHAANADFDMGVEDFTIEFWFRYEGTANTYPIIIGSATAWSAGVVSIAVDHAWGVNKVIVTAHSHNLGAATLSTRTTVTYNTWHHVAVVRNKTTLSIYFNGVHEGETTIAQSLGFNFGLGGLRIGGGNGDGANSYFKGFVDDLRVTKRIARYVSNFIPKTTAFINENASVAGAENSETLDRIVPV